MSQGIESSDLIRVMVERLGRAHPNLMRSVNLSSWRKELERFSTERRSWMPDERALRWEPADFVSAHDRLVLSKGSITLGHLVDELDRSAKASIARKPGKQQQATIATARDQHTGEFEGRQFIEDDSDWNALCGVTIRFAQRVFALPKGHEIKRLCADLPENPIKQIIAYNYLLLRFATDEDIGDCGRRRFGDIILRYLSRVREHRKFTEQHRKFEIDLAVYWADVDAKEAAARQAQVSDGLDPFEV